MCWNFHDHGLISISNILWTNSINYHYYSLKKTNFQAVLYEQPQHIDKYFTFFQNFLSLFPKEEFLSTFLIQAYISTKFR